MKDYKVSDIKLAEWGRKEIQIAETEAYDHSNCGFN